MKDDDFTLFVLVAMHAAIGKAPQTSTVDEIALLAVKQAEAIEKVLKKTKGKVTYE